ncbi:MAG: substrate-binding domain-containing protein [Defluviitaleaceae bacterium]|nr:substrate-binding domain-containing protein [Defluviitaleaceae bacterium]
MKKILALLTASLLIFTACSRRDNEQKTFYVLLNVLGNQYFATLSAGAMQAGEDFGVNVVVLGVSSNSDLETQIRQLKDAVSARVDGVLVAPLDGVAMAPQIAETFNAGIPVVLVDNLVVGDQFSAAFRTNNVYAGTLAAQTLISKIYEAGIAEDEFIQVAIQIPTFALPSIVDRLQGFNEYWAENAPSAWQILSDDIKINDGSIERSIANAQDFLTAYPSLRAIFSPNNGSTVGFIRALTDANRTDIVMVGFDFSPEIEEMIMSEQFVVAGIVQQPFLMGYEGIRAAIALANGEEVYPKINETQVVVVDINNINTPEIEAIIRN